MLDPQDRQILLEALRPPEGREVTFAIGTTYTLDLLALLTAPLGFTQFELAGQPGAELGQMDTVRLLSVLRRYAQKVGVFCEAGRIAVPKRHTLLFGHLEDCVVEVRAPKAHSFHPKVWVIRFESADPAEAPLYRLVCLTRNLTFDQSWDTVLVLDGVVLDRQRGFALNRPLAAFVQALPAMAVREVPGRILASVATAAEELRRVEWELPEGFDELQFHPFGIEGFGYRAFPAADRCLIVSPFLTNSFLQDITRQNGDYELIARTDALEQIPAETLARFTTVSAFTPELAAEMHVSEDTVGVERLSSAGLHAKLYVMERGWNAHVYTGSANATQAAFRGNVEFMVELVGKRSRVGIDVLMQAEKNQVRLCDLLVKFESGGPLPPDIDEAEAKLDTARRTLATLEWEATIETLETGSFRLTLTAKGGGRLPIGTVVTVRPVLLPDHAAQQLDAGTMSAVFESLSFEALSSFFAVDVTLADGKAHEPCRFLINPRLIGEPEGRKERLTQYMLRDREHVVRFLLLLLGGGPAESGVIGPDGEHEKGQPTTASRPSDESMALLEPLLRALHRDPFRLDHVASTIEDLSKTPEGRAKLPEGLEQLWKVVWSAREELRHEEAGA